MRKWVHEIHWYSTDRVPYLTAGNAHAHRFTNPYLASLCSRFNIMCGIGTTSVSARKQTTKHTNVYLFVS